MTALGPNYQDILQSIKDRLQKARIKTAYLVNTELLQVYWEIGNIINKQELENGWGSKTVEKLAKDLKVEVPDMKGLSARNLRYMRDFAKAYPYFPFLQAPLANSNDLTTSQSAILQAPLAKLTWYHHITLLDKVKDPSIRAFYIERTIENGWSRDVMVHQVESGLHHRLGKTSNNFVTTVSPAESELVQQLFKDPYKLEFLALGEEMKERDLENALTNQMTKFLLELGQWFAFVGRQYKLTVGEKDFFIDLLFYHTRLKRYIIIELKIGEFKPEHLGKMEFYLKVADDTLRDDVDGESIGLILCKTKDGLVAEYALRDSRMPIGIAQYELGKALPEDFKGELPSIEEIEEKITEELNAIRSPLQIKLDLLKSKLASTDAEELTTPATFDLLTQLYDKSLQPLYSVLLEKLEPLNTEFISHNYYWTIGDKTYQQLTEFEAAWKDENILRKNFTFSFRYRLNGLKKGGTNAFDESMELQLKLDTYSYTFTLINYNNQAPFFKKLYNQQLTDAEVAQITDTVCLKLIDNIDFRFDSPRSKTSL